eukprot:1813861-Amphidinium_carterae.2
MPERPPRVLVEGHPYPTQQVVIDQCKVLLEPQIIETMILQPHDFRKCSPKAKNNEQILFLSNIGLTSSASPEPNLTEPCF